MKLTLLKRIGLILVAGLPFVKVAAAETSGAQNWIARQAANRPNFPRSYLQSPEKFTLGDHNGESFTTEAELARKHLASDVPLVWELKVSSDAERLAVGTCSPSQGLRWEFAVYTQLGNPTPYYWHGEGYPVCSEGDVFPVAVRRARELFCAGSSEVGVSYLPEVMGKESFRVTGARGKEVDLPFDKAVFVFIDDKPGANWCHPCRYVFFSADLSEFVVSYQLALPRFMRLGSGEEIYLKGDGQKKPEVLSLEQVRNAVYSAANAMERDSNAIAYSGDTSHSYFVLLSGGQYPANNGIRFWADTAMFYSTLRKKYGIPKNQIWVYMSDGTSTGADANLASTSPGVTPVLVSSPQDLDGDGVGDIDGAATKANFQTVLASTLTSRLTSEDQLYVFITSHGGPDGIGGYSNRDCTACLFNSAGDAEFTDDELSTWTRNLRCPVAFAIETCYSGGFIDDITATPKRVIATACNHYENSSGTHSSGVWGGGVTGKTSAFNGWAMPMTAAFRGYWPAALSFSGSSLSSLVAAYPWETGASCSADSNGDGYVSFREASDFANRNDLCGCSASSHPIGCSGGEHPQFSESTSGLGASFFIVKKNSSTSRPANDNFANATVISGSSGSVAGSNVGATYESGEPLRNYKTAATNTVWWSWTAPSTGTARFSTEGTSFDTVMGVYTGSYLSSLSVVKEDDDGGSANTSVCEFSCTSGTRYYIAVSGYGAAKCGVINLRWTATASTTKTLSSISISGFTDTYSGKVRTYACTANYSDGSAATVTPTWSIYSGSSYASINSSGRLTANTVSSSQSVTVKASYASGGVTKTATKTVTVYPTCTLATALDNTTLTFTTGGSADWFGQSVTKYDGTDAARSGLVTHSQDSWMQTTVTGPGTFAFRWYVSSESVSYDYLSFAVDGVQTNKIGGTSGSWTTCSYALGAGSHTLKWNYHKDGSVNVGNDAGYVDQVTWTPTQSDFEISGGVLTKYNGPGGAVTIPSSVTKIGDSAFRDCSAMTSVSLPDALASIDNAAFNGCSGLRSITIPANVTYIAGNAFIGCLSLTSISVASGNPAYKVVLGCLLTKDGKMCLRAPNIASVTIPEGVEEFGWASLSGCTAIQALFLPQSMVAIECWALNGCSSLTELTIPAGVLEIGYGAFRGCESLGRVIFDGDAPALWGVPSIYEDTPDDLVTYVRRGTTGWIEKDMEGLPSVWPVGDEWAHPIRYVSGVTLTSIGISGSASVLSGNTASYMCTATYSDGSTATVSPTWSIYSGTSYATISTNGVLTAKSVTSAQSVTVKASYTFGDVTKTATKTVTVNPATDALPDLAFALFNGWDHGFSLFTIPKGGEADDDPVRVFDKGRGFSLVYGWGNFGTVKAVGEIVNEVKITDYLGNEVYSTDDDDSLDLEPYSGRSIVTTVTSWTNLAAGVYVARVTLDANDDLDEEDEDDNTTTFRFSVRDSVSFGTAADCTSLSFTSIPSDGWFGTRGCGADGVDAIQSAHIGHSSTNTLRTTLSGAGTFSFKWKVSSEAGYDKLYCLIDGEEKSSVSGTDGGWSTCSYTLSAGSHVVEWRYVKDYSLSAGADCAWIDQVTWTVPKTLSSVAISGAASVSGGGSSAYSCTATYSDGTTRTVTPTWTVSSGSAYASISANGTLTARSVSSDQSVTIAASYSEGGVNKTAAKSVSITATSSVGDFGPFDFDPSVGKGLEPSFIVDAEVLIGGEPAAMGDCVGVYRADGILCGTGRMLDDSGLMTIVFYAAQDVRLHFKVWRSASGLQAPPLDADRSSDIIAPEPGRDIEGLVITVSGEESQDILLEEAKWHLLSFCVEPEDNSPAKVFSDVASKVAKVSYGLEYWMPGRTSSLASVEVGKAYWVQTSHPNVSWTVSGSARPNTELTLQSGWTLIGYVPTVAGTVEDVLGTAIASGAISRISHGLDFYIPGRTGTLGMMYPGEAYWVMASTASTIRYDSAGASNLNAVNRVANGLLPWVFDESVGRGLEPTTVWDALVSIDGAPLSGGDYVAAFNDDGVMCGGGPVLDNSGTVTFLLFAREGTPINFKIWRAEDGKVFDVLPSCDISAPADGGDILDLVLQAISERNEYSVRFDANGGEGTMMDQAFVYDEEQVLRANGFTRAGYTFAGWATSADGAVRYEDGATVKNLATSGTVTLYARWTANGYTVEFNVNGGTGTMMNEAMVYDMAQALTACAFTRNGYTFAGWATSAGGAVKYADGAEVKNLATSGTVTLYARWTAVPSTSPASVSVSLGSGAGSANSATFAASSAASWMFDRSEIPSWVTSIELYYGNSGHLAFGPGSGTISLPVGGSAYFIVTTSANTGSGARNWSWNLKDTAGNAVCTLSVVQSAPVPAPTYTVTLNANGGTCSTATKQYSSGATLGTLPTATRAGYAFDGWFTAASGGTKASSSTVATGDVTLYAHWTAIRYAITYNLNGGSNSSANPATYTVEDTVTLAAPTRAGYKFLGWTPNGGAIARGSIGDKAFTANWEKTPGPSPVDPVHPVEEPPVLVDESSTHVDVVGGEEAPYEKAAAVYDGYLYDADGNVAGAVQVKVAKGKVDKKIGAFAAKATATVQLAGSTKKLSFKGGVADEYGNVTEMADKNGNVLAASLGVNGLGGELRRAGGVSYRIDGARNLFADKDAEAKATAKEIETKWVGAVNVVGGDVALAVSIAKKGKVKVSGTAGGAKVSATSQLLVGDGGVCCVPVVITKKANLAFNLWLLPDGGVELAGLDGVEAGKAGTLKPGAAFSIEDGGDALAEALPELLDEFLPDGVEVAANGKKWVVAPDEKGKAAKAGKIKLVDGDPVDVQDSANPSGLKLTYTAKSGAFKGSFKAYAIVNGKIKSYTVNVAGVMLGDKALGTATLKKPAVSFPIAIE